jgi:hypothetical protein
LVALDRGATKKNNVTVIQTLKTVPLKWQLPFQQMAEMTFPFQLMR